MAQWEDFFDEVISFIRITLAREVSESDDAVLKLDNYIRVLSAINDTLNEELEADADMDVQEVATEVETLVHSMEEIRSHWVDVDVGVHLPRAKKVRSGGRGRPHYIIQREQIQFLRELHFTWTQIASLFGVCRKTLYTIRMQLGMVDFESAYHFTAISDQDLQAQVARIKRVMPDAGQTMVRGMLRSQGIHVSITRIRDCIAEVDPVNTALRWAATTHRRTYSVPRPNSLWHLDGNHKLIR